MNSATKTKYRPVLTSIQISHIINLAKTDIMREEPVDVDFSISLLSVLAPFEAKVQNEGVVAAYINKPTSSEKLLDSLGEGAKELLFNGRTKEEYWEECYNKYILTPDACSLQELHGAREHMYLNSLMTPQQVTEFEKQLGYTS